MAQITNGLRAILSHPRVYSSFQLMMGADSFRKDFVSRFVRPFPGMTLLDIGCGPADILEHLPDVDYWGFDISEAYIKRAERRFGQRGRFFCRELQADELSRLPKFDIVLAIGLLHHLDDQIATSVAKLAHSALKQDGRFLSVDPCLDPSQNAIARLLVQHDRGQNVRTRAGYESVALSAFESPRALVQPQVWIPYTHCIMECRR